MTPAGFKPGPGSRTGVGYSNHSTKALTILQIFLHKLRQNKFHSIGPRSSGEADDSRSKVPEFNSYKVLKKLLFCYHRSYALSKCDTRKLSKVYRYREKFIDNARNFDTIVIPDIISTVFLIRYCYPISYHLFYTNHVKNK